SPVVSFAVTAVSLWVVTAASEVYLYAKNGTEPIVGTDCTWIHVKTMLGCTVDKIRASSNGAYVWIFSSTTGRAWARSFVNDSSRSGKSWIETSNDPGVCELAVGCKVIWSLSSSGQLYRLQGLAIGNPAGNYWKPVPIFLKTIAVDRKDRLWGIDMDKRLILQISA
ncbi:unnamed protein product, partial [Gongylonema pulchrum]|uniref:Bulb-type lectin domain-containing protein n=1 Tax=Gongylonema pulchrum TaxID=637853 RepID=A0A183EY80_9BILA